MFIFYINDIPNISSDFKAILFADDTDLIFDKKISTLKILNSTLSNIQLP